MEVIRDADASLQPLLERSVAIIGYGNQGRAQALNLRDSGVSVLVGSIEPLHINVDAIQASKGAQPQSICWRMGGRCADSRAT